MNKLLLVSQKGISLKGETLNEDTLPGRQLVAYRNRLYITGNRKNSIVELYGIADMELKYLAKIKSISIVKNELR